MDKFLKIFKKIYIFIILILFYIPIIWATIFSFNTQPKKGDLSFHNFNISIGGWKELFSSEYGNPILNSFIIAIFVSFFVSVISLITVFGLWKQKSKIYKVYVDNTSNIPLINPDIITAISLSIIFSFMFGILQIDNDGIWRAIVSHSIMSLPFALVLLYPRSEKFKASILESSQDLGYSPIKSWFKTYFRFMMPTLFSVIIIVFCLSFDDFILTRLNSNVTTIGTKLYEGSFKVWALCLGTIMFFLTMIFVFIFAIIKRKANDY